MRNIWTAAADADINGSGIRAARCGILLLYWRTSCCCPAQGAAAVLASVSKTPVTCAAGLAARRTVARPANAASSRLENRWFACRRAWRAFSVTVPAPFFSVHSTQRNAIKNAACAVPLTVYLLDISSAGLAWARVGDDDWYPHQRVGYVCSC